MLALIIKETLADDSTFSGYMEGGIYSVADADEIGRSQTPNAYDANGELRPCCYIRPETRQADGPHDNGAVEYVTIYFYQRSGYSSSTAAMDRAFVLLQKAKFEGVKVYELVHTDDLLGQSDPHLGTTLQMSRYGATRLRG
ncbi:MAG: hypothetical protein KA314_05120 [Chloroflexi bacterium]|nr:hypothetical protein [Chloroflexota bacterium]